MTHDVVRVVALAPQALDPLDAIGTSSSRSSWSVPVGADLGAEEVGEPELRPS